MTARRLPSFLYRRLCRWVTCEFSAGDGEHRIRMQTKYDVASFADVFCRPFYWQCFHLMRRAPGLVIDCGAHCGHFTLLAHQCVQARFPDSPPPRYLLVEPNPGLASVIQRNLADAGLASQAQLVPALVGVDGTQATLWVNPHNYLVSSFQPHAGAKPHIVRCATLAELAGDERIDVLKVDIEGGEFGLVEREPAVFDRVDLLLMEAHGTPEQRTQLVARLRDRGLNFAADPIPQGTFELYTFSRA